MRLTTFIGLRFLRAPRMSWAISAITWGAFVSITLGVAALLIVTSVLNGFTESFFEAGTASIPDVRIEAPDRALSGLEITQIKKKLQPILSIQAITHHVSRQAFLRYKQIFQPVILRGVDPNEELLVTRVQPYIKTNPFWPLSEHLSEKYLDNAAFGEEMKLGRGLQGLIRSSENGKPQQTARVVIGAQLAERLGVGIGDQLELISHAQRLTPIGPLPLIKRVQIAGVLQTGIDTADATLVYVERSLARKLFLMGKESDSIGLRVSDPHHIELARIQAAISNDLQLIPWYDKTRNLLQVLALEKLGLFVLLSLVIVIGFLNMICSLTMLVLEKKVALATLKTLGSSNPSMGMVFFKQGLWLGLFGTLFGLGLGLSMCWAISQFSHLLLSSNILKVFDHVPVSIHWADISWIVASTFVLCMLTTLFPAWQAVKLWPIAELKGT